MFVGWNAGKSAPLALSSYNSLAKNQTFGAEDGVNACKFRLDAKLNFTVGNNQEKLVDLSGGDKHLLVATGSGSSSSLSYHLESKVRGATTSLIPAMMHLRCKYEISVVHQTDTRVILLLETVVAVTPLGFGKVSF